MSKQAMNDWMYQSLTNVVLHRSARKVAMPTVLKRIEETVRKSDKTGLDYVVKMTSSLIGNLVRSMIRNMDHGFVSQHAARTVLDTLVKTSYVNPASAQAREEYTRRFGTEPPGFCVLSPTQRCNLNCTGCYAGSGADTRDTLPYAVCSRLLNEMHDVLGGSFIVISGGEPFLYRSEGKGLLDLTREHHGMYFLTYTNGQLIDEEVARELGALGNLTPAISIEGREAETDRRRGKGVFSKVLRTTERLKKHGVPFGLSVTVTKENAELLSGRSFYEYCFEELGATYMWMFHLMPIGRASATMDLMVTPEQRRRLFETWERLTLDTDYFVGDFWNSGVAAHGCIAYGRPGGYFYVNWNGNVTPCAFVPYYKHNIVDLYAQGRSITDALMSDLFSRGRHWQQEYLRGSALPGNLLMPCSIRDHYAEFRENVMDPNVQPENEPARQAIEDPDYYRRLTEFDTQLSSIMTPLWEERVGGSAGARAKAGDQARKAAV